MLQRIAPPHRSRYRTTGEFWRRTARFLPLLIILDTAIGIAVSAALLNWEELPLALAASHILGTAAYLGSLPCQYARFFSSTPLRQALLFLCSMPLFLVGGSYLVWELPGFSALTGSTDHAPQALMMAALASLGLALIYYDGRWRLAEQRRRAEEAERQSLEQRLHTMQTHIEPELLSATLSNIDELITRSPGDAKSLLINLNSYLRASLSHARGRATTLLTEFSLLHAYLHMMAVRTHSDLRVKIHCAQECESLQFPPMLLQPLVDSALGESFAQNDGGDVLLTAHCVDEMLEIHLCHTHHGSSSEATATDASLAPVRERLAGLFGSRATVQRAMQPKEGAGIVMRIPIDSLEASPA